MHSLVYIRGKTTDAKVPQMKIKYLLINLSCKLDNLLLLLSPFSAHASGVTPVLTGGVASLRALLLHD